MEFLETVIDSNGNPKWLVREEVVFSESNIDLPIDEIIKRNNPIRTKYIYKIEEPGLVRCFKCGAIMPKKQGVTPPLCLKENGGCGRRSVFTVVTPDPWLYWRPIPYKGELEPQDISLFHDILSVVKKCIVFQFNIEYTIFVLWCMASWKYESFDTVPYLHFLGPMESGKTIGIDLIDRLAYRTFEVGKVSIPAIPRITSLYKSTLTLDEAQAYLSSRSETAETLKAIFKAGYRKGQHYVIADKEDPDKVIMKDVFGFKAFASTKMFDDALHSRSIVFWMKEAKPEVKNLKEYEDDFADLRYRLMCYRYMNDEPPPYPDYEIDLYGRIRELFEPIIRTAMHFDLPIDEIVKYAKKQKIQQLEDLYSSDYADVLSVIYESMHGIEEREYMLLKEIADRCDLTPQRIGYILKDLGVKTKRISEGKIVPIKDVEILKQLEYLFHKFGVGQYKVVDNINIEKVDNGGIK